jgi:4'-phosphopantetheinyl transferase
VVDAWEFPLSDLQLSKGEIHIWRSDLDLPMLSFPRLFRYLSVDERTRAERFLFEKDKKRFIAGVGILRALLGLYLDTDPCELRFHYGDHGKPRLSDESGKEILYFNRSSSEGRAVYGFTRDCEIGVDIEYIRDLPEMNRITERYFSEIENEVFGSLPENEKREAFFNCWTIKEALVKATGDGLFRPLDSFEVFLGPDEPARLINVAGNPSTAARWSIQSFKPAPGYAAAFAVEGHDWKLYQWQWPEQSDGACSFEQGMICRIPTN